MAHCDEFAALSGGFVINAKRTAGVLAPIVCAVTVITMLASPVTALSPQTIFEWGEPVAAGGPGYTPTPVQAAQIQSDILQIDAGNQSDVAVVTNSNSNSVWAWGNDGVGNSSMKAVSLPDTDHVFSPIADGNASFAAVENASQTDSCPNSTSVEIWGVEGSTPYGPKDDTSLDCDNVVQVAGAAGHYFALTAKGQVYAWGSANYGTLGLGEGVKSVANPRLVPAITSLTDGTATGVHLTTGMNFAEIDVNGQIWSWGDNRYGQCGCGSTKVAIYAPTPLAAPKDAGVPELFTTVDDGGNLLTDGHALAIDTRGDVWAWGDNAAGQLGNGGTIDSNVPVMVSQSWAPATIVEVAAGGRHSMALDSAGNVWTWGYNAEGEVGNGTTENVATPIKVLSNVSEISAGSYHSLALVDARPSGAKK